MTAHDQTARLLRDRTNRFDFAASDGAQRTLREMGEAALPGLLHAIRQPEGGNFQLHWEAVNALAEIGGAAVPGLLDLLLRDDLPEGARWAVGEALGYIGAPAVRGLVAAASRSDSDIRHIALYALVACAGEDAVPHLLNAVRDEDPQVSLAALKVLKNTGAVSALAALREVLAADQCASSNALRWAIRSLEAVPERELHG